MSARLSFGLVSAVLCWWTLACGDANELILATTTSTQDSGLLDELIPLFEEETGYQVKVVAVGSGQALRLGERGEADVILAHSPEAEEKFMAAGQGIDRRLVMHNDFVIVGPNEDPAGGRGAASAGEALAAIARSTSTFLSRGDESGTHARELELWEAIGVVPAGSWYQDTGQGMGQTLVIANEKRGYTLSDRATFLAQQRNLDLAVLFEGDPQLFNVYHVIAVNPAKHGRVNAEGAVAFGQWLTSSRVQEVIRSFGVERYGQPLFVPDAYLEATPGIEGPP